MRAQKTLSIIKWSYKVARSFIFSAIIVIVVLFALFYIAISIPPVQNAIREAMQEEVATFLGSDVKIGNLTIRPVNEVIIEDAVFMDQKGKECLNVGRLGAGINLWRLLFRGEIEITYVELLNFKANIYQETADSPLNIDYIIEAFKPKDKNKPPTKFDLKIHNIVLRGGEANFSRLWIPKKDNDTFDFNHISVSDLSADIAFPRLSNDATQLDLRKLSLVEQSGLILKELSGEFTLSPETIKVAGMNLRLPETNLKFGDLTIPTAIFKPGNERIGPVEISIIDSRITPSNFSVFYGPLASFDRSYALETSIKANRQIFDVLNFQLGNDGDFNLSLSGNISNLIDNRQNLSVELRSFDLSASPNFLDSAISLIPEIGRNSILKTLFDKAGTINVTADGAYMAKNSEFNLNSTFITNFSEIAINGEGKFLKNVIDGAVTVDIVSLNLSEILPDIPIGKLENAQIKYGGSINTKDPNASNGNMEFALNTVEISRKPFSHIFGSAGKTDNQYKLDLNIDDERLNGDVAVTVLLDGSDTKWDLDLNLHKFNSYSVGLMDELDKSYEARGVLHASATGNSLENLTGNLSIENLFIRNGLGKTIDLQNLQLSVLNPEKSIREINLSSEIADFVVQGAFEPAMVPGMMKRIMGEICPALFPTYIGRDDAGSAIFTVDIKDADQLIEFFSIPVIPLTALTIEGSFDSTSDNLDLRTTIPYIQQGNNLITDTYLDIEIKGAERSAKILAGTIYPTKKGLLKLDLDLFGKDGLYDIYVYLNKERSVAFDGTVYLKVQLEKNPVTHALEVIAQLSPSDLQLNGTQWNLDESEIIYSNEGLIVDNFCLQHEDQFVRINGANYKNGEGTITLGLSDINLDYIFETLNINHVTFGGTATGEFIAQKIFSKDPCLESKRLIIDKFSYNGAPLGRGDVYGKFNLPEKKVSILAKIRENDKLVADVDGGIWIGKDSLAFNFKADSVNIGFMQPFMAAFSSDVKGRASGTANLYGTFSDIDMTGKLIAHDADIMVDYINARYKGSDTIYLHPGRIEIPSFKVYDKFGHTAILTGELTHRYFHEPAFNFQIKEMDGLLVYDTNAQINPLWYGTLFASGAGEIVGRPGLVRIAADVETRKGSDFTFVLSDQQEAVKSNFLTFTDKRKEALEAAEPKDTIPEFLKRFQRHAVNSEESSDIFSMDFRVSVTDGVKFNLIMDPVAGDKITAYGSGAMNMTYSSLTDELKLYGKYTLDRGIYNFSLQDIILKEFTIKPGSTIAFTGNPYTGVLDITAAYKVNTSLTELDRSFANDRELNRTSVPVEALLDVTGVLTSPHITFDIELPTVTEETAQKVRSIISTEDMMNRQVLYLVALNKFYPPEYMTTSNSGGEWASIASSTISSQIQNVIGQITDKFTLAPSIRSDKGDFSDIEVDLALSSQLFNNRLLINGNLGYRDPSNSSTTFIGDFDLEYLLNRRGTWRLKAYNHFNDQNYYLKSALTTQGLGIIWRKEFGLPREKKENE